MEGQIAAPPFGLLEMTDRDIPHYPCCHCEERSDAAIPISAAAIRSNVEYIRFGSIAPLIRPADTRCTPWNMG